VASAQVSSRGGAQLVPPVSDVLPRRRSRWAARKQAYMFASPALFLILVFVIFPLGYSLYLTFRNYDLAIGPPTEFVGLENYVEIFEDTRSGARGATPFLLFFRPLVCSS
jgi:raffinose/stachyose/melibiose transport system permease protein